MASPDPKVLFGRRVRQLRKSKGYSQEQFAINVKIDRSYYGSIERGERNVSLDTICQIAAGLGVTPADLLRFELLAPDIQSDSASAASPGSEAD